MAYHADKILVAFIATAEQESAWLRAPPNRGTRDAVKVSECGQTVRRTELRTFFDRLVIDLCGED